MKGRPAVTRQSSIWRGFGGETFSEKFYETFVVIGMHDFIPRIVQHLGEYPNVFLHGAGAYPWSDPFYTDSFLPPKLKIPDRTRN